MGHFRQPDIQIIGVFKGDNKMWGGKGAKKYVYVFIIIQIEDIMANIFSNWVKIINPQTQEAQ